MDVILKTMDLTKKYNNNTVVDKVNMTITKGEIYGFLGKNGAGKTTALKMIMGHTSITSGNIELFGQTVGDKDYLHKSRIGLLMETPLLYPKLNVRDNLNIHRRYMGVQDEKRIDEVLELVNLHEASSKSIEKISIGMKQRLSFARALLNNPEFLILDEPTNGLDQEGISDVRDIILRLNRERNITILISSHLLSEIQQVATKIGIIHKGILLEEMQYKEFEKNNRNYLQLKVKDDKKASVILEDKCGITQYKVCQDGLIQVFEKLESAEYINRQMVINEVGITELHINNESLEDYFLRLTGGRGND